MTDHPIDPVAVRNCAVERLQQYEAAAFAANEAVRPFVERVDAAGRRKHIGAGECDEGTRIEHAVDAACQRHVAGAGAQVTHCLVDGNERRRACRVDGNARPFQIEAVGDSISCDRERRTRAGKDIPATDTSAAKVLREIVGRDAKEYTGACATQIGQCAVGVLDGLERHLQRQALLRVHRRHLAGRHVEETRVEAENIAGKKSAPARPHLSPRIGLRIVEGVNVPAVRRDIYDAAVLLQEKVPVRFRVLNPSREPATDPDNRDWLRRVNDVLGRIAPTMNVHAQTPA